MSRLLGGRLPGLQFSSRYQCEYYVPCITVKWTPLGTRPPTVTNGEQTENCCPEWVLDLLLPSIFRPSLWCCSRIRLWSSSSWTAVFLLCGKSCRCSTRSRSASYSATSITRRIWRADRASSTSNAYRKPSLRTRQRTRANMRRTNDHHRRITRPISHYYRQFCFRQSASSFRWMEGVLSERKIRIARMWVCKLISSQRSESDDGDIAQPPGWETDSHQWKSRFEGWCVQALIREEHTHTTPVRSKWSNLEAVHSASGTQSTE